MKKISLTQGKYAIVDDSDYVFLNKNKWFANKIGNTFYAVRTEGKKGNSKTICMHRVIMNTPKGMDTDHIDGDGLNNQKRNLRICTHSQNICNRGIQKNSTSEKKGVTWNRLSKKWQAQIKSGGKYFYLGVFKDKEKAYKTYCDACIKYHGNFSNLIK